MIFIKDVSVENEVLSKWSPVKSSTFKGGEENVRLSPEQVTVVEKATTIYIKAHLDSSSTLMAFMLIVDAIRRITPDINIKAFIPYLPYARQDRDCNPGEALSLAVVANMINSLNLSTVTLLDPHSDVSKALIHNSLVLNLSTYLIRHDAFPGLDFADVYLVAPDAGAQKKVKELARVLGAAGYITATKERNLETMEITGTKFDGDVTGKRLLVVDDICDGGRTFIELAKSLHKHNPLELHLWVTHGIFSYGTELVTDHFDSVVTTNSFRHQAVGQLNHLGEYDYKMNWLQI